jgi:phosphate transport system substrate-binding protein
LADYYGSLGLVFLIAKDALSIYLHPDNPVHNLTFNQLKKIYIGDIDNWKTVGGVDTLIQLITRNPNSGTYLYFKDHILDAEEYGDNSLIIPTTREIVKYVEQNINAIGYGGMGYTGKVKHIKIDEVEPSETNVRNDTYPITRYLHFFTTKSPGGEVKRFIDWVLSPAGQSVVRKAGFIPLWENKL